MFLFDKNFGRLNNLLILHKSLPTERGPRSSQKMDILRATTVLIHATLEDYLRNLLLWKLPTAPREKLSKIPLVNTSEITRATKFDLGDLALYREETVDDVITASVKQYLDTVSFNNTTDIAGWLAAISIKITAELQALFPSLDDMIKRRHNIVHRADRNDSDHENANTIKSLTYSQVSGWRKILDDFVGQVNLQVPE